MTMPIFDSAANSKEKIQTIETAHQKSYPHPSYRPDIDGLRAVAVLSVVGFHAFPTWVKSGFVGVDVFFVISGFLISSIILNGLVAGHFSFVEFYVRRVKRIFPALFLVLLSVLVCGWLLLLPDEFKQLGKHVAGGGAFVANLMLWSEAGYFDAAAELKPLLHLWSLGVEEQFYIIWPVLLLALFRLRLNLLAATVIVIGISFIANIGRIGSHPIEVFFLPMSRFWELLAGGILAYFSVFKISDRFKNSGGYIAYVIRSQQVFRNLLSLVGIVLIMVAVFAMGKDFSFPGWFALAPVLAAFFLIAAGPSAWINRRILSHPTFVFVGLISYPVYLWHWPILSFARIVNSGTPSLKIRIGAVVLSIILGWLTYRWIERPVRFRKTLVVPCVLFAMITLVSLTGLVVFLKNGIPERFPPIIQKLESYKLNRIYADWREHRCFLEPADDRSKFDPSVCIDPVSFPGPLILLWGDSHAGAAFPGLRALQTQKSFRLAQFNVSSCPPFVGFETPDNINCKGANEEIIGTIGHSMPDIVVLHANWLHPRFNVLKDEDRVDANLSATVERLRDIGIKRIIVLGPVPQWVDGLPKTLLKHYRADPLHHLPERIPYTNDGIPHADLRMRELAMRLSVEYVSALDILCNTNDGCLAVLGQGDQLSLTAFDYGHLTPSGAKVLADGLAPFLFAEPSLPRLESSVPLLKPSVPLPELGNLIWPSEQFDHKIWNPVGVNRVAQDVMVAPDGTKSADLLIENTAAGLHRLETVVQGVTADKPYVFSVYAKAAGRSKLRLELLDTHKKKYGTATYDLQTLKLLANTGDVVRGGIEQDRDGWVRCWAQASFGGNVAAVTLTLADDKVAHDYVGNGKSGLVFWGAQLSPGTMLSKYTVTSTAPTN